MVNHDAAQNSEVMQMCRALVEKIRVMEGHNSTILNALETCLAPDVVFPPKFKVRYLKKYKGLRCPNIHLKMYFKNTVAYDRDNKFMIHYFQDSLTRAYAE